MIELNEQQQHALDQQGAPLQVTDPRTKEGYVLIRAEVYERVQRLLTDDTVYATAELVDRVMAEDDANDPHPEEYQRLYSGKCP